MRVRVHDLVPRLGGHVFFGAQVLPRFAGILVRGFSVALNRGFSAPRNFLGELSSIYGYLLLVLAACPPLCWLRKGAEVLWLYRISSTLAFLRFFPRVFFVLVSQSCTTLHNGEATLSAVHYVHCDGAVRTTCNKHVIVHQNVTRKWQDHVTDDLYIV